LWSSSLSGTILKFLVRFGNHGIELVSASSSEFHFIYVRSKFLITYYDRQKLRHEYRVIDFIAENKFWQWKKWISAGNDISTVSLLSSKTLLFHFIYVRSKFLITYYDRQKLRHEYRVIDFIAENKFWQWKKWISAGNDISTVFQQC